MPNLESLDTTPMFSFAPAGWIPLKARIKTELAGGLYRHGDTFFIYQRAVSGVGALFIGNKPYIWDEVPREFTRLIAHR